MIINALTDIPLYMIKYKEKDPCTSSTHYIVKIQERVTSNEYSLHSQDLILKSIHAHRDVVEPVLKE